MLVSGSSHPVGGGITGDSLQALRNLTRIGIHSPADTLVGGMLYRSLLARVPSSYWTMSQSYPRSWVVRDSLLLPHMGVRIPVTEWYLANP